MDFAWHSCLLKFRRSKLKVAVRHMGVVYNSEGAVRDMAGGLKFETGTDASYQFLSSYTQTNCCQMLEQSHSLNTLC